MTVSDTVGESSNLLGTIVFLHAVENKDAYDRRIIRITRSWYSSILSRISPCVGSSPTSVFIGIVKTGASRGSNGFESHLFHLMFSIITRIILWVALIDVNFITLCYNVVYCDIYPYQDITRNALRQVLYQVNMSISKNVKTPL